MKIFFSVGEPSGDLHGANLIRQLSSRQPDLQAVGYGGPRMAAAGCQLHEDLTQLAVMWFLNVLLNIRKFYRLLRQAEHYFAEDRPDAVVLIDYPGFNWWIARAAKKHDIPVFYYGAPQIWAWASWRINKMRRLIDHTLCKLPFEADWYNEQGCLATYVGHPYFDEMENRRLDEDFLRSYGAGKGPLVTILPGSRTQEVTHNLHWFLKSASLIRREREDVRFAIAAFNEKQAALAKEQLQKIDIEADVFVGRTPELIELAACCMACSGSVSLELLYHAKPSVILYYIGRIPYLIQSHFRKVKYITLVNLLEADELFPKDNTPYDSEAPGAEQLPFPEYLTCEDKSPHIAAHITAWLSNKSLYEERAAKLKALKAKYGRSGASSTAAELLLQLMADPKIAERPSSRAA